MRVRLQSRTRRPLARGSNSSSARFRSIAYRSLAILTHRHAVHMQSQRPTSQLGSGDERRRPVGRSQVLIGSHRSAQSPRVIHTVQCTVPTFVWAWHRGAATGGSRGRATLSTGPPPERFAQQQQYELDSRHEVASHVLCSVVLCDSWKGEQRDGEGRGRGPSARLGSALLLVLPFPLIRLHRSILIDRQ